MKENFDINVPYSKKYFRKQNTRDEMKHYLTLAYLRFNLTASGEVHMTLNDICSSSGFSIKTKESPPIKVFKNDICNLVKNGYLIPVDGTDISEIKNTQYTKFKLSDDNSLFYCSDNFVVLSLDEYNKIVSSETSSKKDVLLTAFLTIKQYIYDTDTAIPKVAFPSKKTIQKVLGVKSTRTVDLAINDLIKLGLLYCKTDLYVLSNDNVYKQVRNVYALTQSELKHSKEVLKECYHTSQIYDKSELPDNYVLAHAK